MMPTDLKYNFTHNLIEPEVMRAKSWRGVSAEFVRMETAAEYEFEWHGGSHYIALHDLIMRDGELTIEGMAPVPGGDVRDMMSYVPPERPFKGWSQSADRVNKFLIVTFDPATLSEETETLYREGDFAPQIYFQDGHLQQTLSKLQSVMSVGSRFDTMYAEALGLIAALEIFQLQGQTPSPAVLKQGGLSLSQMKLVDEFIRDQLGTELSLDMLANITGLSRFHFSRAFKVSFGVPPHHYLRGCRVERAKVLLSTTPADIQTISVAVGLKTSVQLIRAFRQLLGTTPGKYRRSS